MKRLCKSWQLTALCGIILFATSCEKKPIDSPETFLGGSGNILVATTVKNADGMSGSSYLQQIPSITGSLTNSNAIQIGFASSITVIGNDVFVFPEFGKDGIQQLKKYTRSDKGLQIKGTLNIAPQSYPNNLVKVSDDKAYMPLYSLGTVWIINPKTMTKTGEISLQSYAHTDVSPEPSYGIIRDGLYYLPLDQIDLNWMPYTDYLQSDVAIIDATSDKVVKVISEKTTGLCFPTRPFLKNMIFTNEQNDIYIACTGYFGYNPEYTKNGFLCIPAGKQEFDTSKSWDISSVDIKGTEHPSKDKNGNEKDVCYKPSTVYNCKYIGNGKIAAYVGIIELMTNNPYTARNSMAVIIDLNDKTIKKIDGIPLTDGHSVAIESHNGQIIFGAYGESQAGFFTYNPSTEEVKLSLTTIGNPAFIHPFQ